MNILTKIFIVLVSLLAVMLVPLVVVNATNASALKGRLADVEARAVTAESSYRQLQASAKEAEQSFAAQSAQLAQQIAGLRQERQTQEAALVRLESEIAGKTEMLAEFNAALDVLAETDRSKAELTEALVSELRDVRDRQVAAEREVVTLYEELAKLENDLEVAVAARRALQEELTRISEERNAAIGSVAQFVALYGDLPSARAGGTDRVPADRDLEATVLTVRRSQDGTLAEVNVGSRDGVRVGWVMTVADESGFISNLRIVEVDVNRATGVVELENRSTRGSVAEGMRAIARRGE